MLATIARPAMPLFRPLAKLPLRAFTTTSLHASSSQSKSFSRAGPPPLPAADQAEFDALLKANATVGATPAIVESPEEALHRDLRKGPKKEFEGDVNPRTGESGGPKVDPFKSGDADWSYAGRVTVSAAGTACDH
jgi:hypothetical protein